MSRSRRGSQRATGEQLVVAGRELSRGANRLRVRPVEAEVDALLWRHAETKLSARSVPLAGMVTVSFSEPFQGAGWRFRQPHPGGGIVWSGPGKTASVDIPVLTPRAAELELFVEAAANAAVLDQLHVDVNGVAVPLVAARSDGARDWTL